MDLHTRHDRTRHGDSPETIYLDTALWYQLTRDEELWPVFHGAVVSGRLVPVLSIHHLLEFARVPEGGDAETTLLGRIHALEIEGVLHWLPRVHVRIRQEARLACLRHLDLPGDGFQSLHVDMIDAMPESGNGQRPPTPRNGIQAAIQIFRYHPAAKGLEAIRRRYPPMLSNSRMYQRKTRSPVLTDEARIKLIAEELPRSIPVRPGVNRQLTDRQRMEIASEIAPDKIPTLFAVFAYREGVRHCLHSTKPSEVDDMGHLVALPYVRTVFMDKRMCEIMRQGRSSLPPAPNARFGGWLEQLAQEN